jgi:hypothetical protein
MSTPKLYTDPAQVIADLNAKGVAIGKVNPDQYHKWKGVIEAELSCPVVSKSTLADFSANPYKFHYDQVNGIKKESDALALGSLVDCLALTPELFDSKYRVEEKRVALKKDGTPYANGQQDPAQKAEWEQLSAQGIRIITPEQKAEADEMAALVNAHYAKRFMVLNENCWSQVAIWVRFTELDGRELPCPVSACGMLDLTDMLHTLDDLKTTSVDLSNTRALFYSIEDYRYGMQAALYHDLYLLATEENWACFGFLFVSTKKPYMLRRVEMTEEAIELYRREAYTAIRRYATRWKLNEWGSPELDFLLYTPSSREYNLIEERENA